MHLNQALTIAAIPVLGIFAFILFARHHKIAALFAIVAMFSSVGAAIHGQGSCISTVSSSSTCASSSAATTTASGLAERNGWSQDEVTTVAGALVRDKGMTADDAGCVAVNLTESTSKARFSAETPAELRTSLQVASSSCSAAAWRALQ